MLPLYHIYVETESQPFSWKQCEKTFTSELNGVCRLYSRANREFDESYSIDETITPESENEILLKNKRLTMTNLETKQLFFVALPNCKKFKTWDHFWKFTNIDKTTVNGAIKIINPITKQHSICVQFKQSKFVQECFYNCHGKRFFKNDTLICHTLFALHFQVFDLKSKNSKNNEIQLPHYDSKYLLSVPLCPNCIERLDASISNVWSHLCEAIRESNANNMNGNNNNNNNNNNSGTVNETQNNGSSSSKNNEIQSPILNAVGTVSSANSNESNDDGSGNKQQENTENSREHEMEDDHDDALLITPMNGDTPGMTGGNNNINDEMHSNNVLSIITGICRCQNRWNNIDCTVCRAIKYFAKKVKDKQNGKENGNETQDSSKQDGSKNDGNRHASNNNNNNSNSGLSKSKSNRHVNVLPSIMEEEEETKSEIKSTNDKNGKIKAGESKNKKNKNNKNNKNGKNNNNNGSKEKKLSNVSKAEIDKDEEYETEFKECCFGNENIDSEIISQLWMCLVCNNIGCGRTTNQHALKHFESSKHRFTIQLNDLYIWDYIDDRFVQRLFKQKIHIINTSSNSNNGIMNSSKMNDKTEKDDNNNNACAVNGSNDMFIRDENICGNNTSNNNNNNNNDNNDNGNTDCITAGGDGRGGDCGGSGSGRDGVYMDDDDDDIEYYISGISSNNNNNNSNNNYNPQPSDRYEREMVMSKLENLQTWYNCMLMDAIKQQSKYFDKECEFASNEFDEKIENKKKLIKEIENENNKIEYELQLAQLWQKYQNKKYENYKFKKEINTLVEQNRLQKLKKEQLKAKYMKKEENMRQSKNETIEQIQGKIENVLKQLS